MYDIDIRIILKKYLADEYADTKTIIVDEFKICWGDARVDVAVVNSNLHGYEIKSDNDTLERLPSQIAFYGQVFDTMSLVCTKKWLSKSRIIIPAWWGIIVAEDINGSITIKRLRKERLNKKVNLRSILELTWKNEALEILASHQQIKNFKYKTRFYIWDEILKNVPDDVIKEMVRDCIKSRDYWRSSASLQRLYAD